MEEKRIIALEEENKKLKEEIKTIKEELNTIKQKQTENDEIIKKLLKINEDKEELKKINSKILTTPEQFHFIEKLINEDNNLTIKKLELKLLYRATRDGGSSLQFHKKCDDINNTITLVKTKTGYIFGGFTTKKWNGNEYKNDDKAFCFSFDLNKKYNSKKTNNSIYCSRGIGPCFGDAFFWVNNNCFSEGGVITEFNICYDNQKEKNEINNGQQKFAIEEVEVFQTNLS